MNVLRAVLFENLGLKLAALLLALLVYLNVYLDRPAQMFGGRHRFAPLEVFVAERIAQQRVVTAAGQHREKVFQGFRHARSSG